MYSIYKPCWMRASAKCKTVCDSCMSFTLAFVSKRIVLFLRMWELSVCNDCFISRWSFQFCFNPFLSRSDKEPDTDQGKSRECLFQAKVKTRETEIRGIQTVGKRIVKKTSRIQRQRQMCGGTRGQAEVVIRKQKSEVGNQ